jgi:CheY-like chemotaxis protein
MVVTDHSMSPINGVQLIKAIRERGAKTPIIMVSAHTDMRDESEAAGVDLFLGGENLLGVGKRIADFLQIRGLAGYG